MRNLPCTIIILLTFLSTIGFCEVERECLEEEVCAAVLSEGDETPLLQTLLAHSGGKAGGSASVDETGTSRHFALGTLLAQTDVSLATTHELGSRAQHLQHQHQQRQQQQKQEKKKENQKEKEERNPDEKVHKQLSDQQKQHDDLTTEHRSNHQVVAGHHQQHDRRHRQSHQKGSSSDEYVPSPLLDAGWAQGDEAGAAARAGQASSKGKMPAVQNKEHSNSSWSSAVVSTLPPWLTAEIIADQALMQQKVVLRFVLLVGLLVVLFLGAELFTLELWHSCCVGYADSDAESDTESYFTNNGSPLARHSPLRDRSSTRTPFCRPLRSLLANVGYHLLWASSSLVNCIWSPFSRCMTWVSSPRRHMLETRPLDITTVPVGIVEDVLSFLPAGDLSRTASASTTFRCMSDRLCTPELCLEEVLRMGLSLDWHAELCRLNLDKALTSDIPDTVSAPMMKHFLATKKLERVHRERKEASKRLNEMAADALRLVLLGVCWMCLLCQVIRIASEEPPLPTVPQAAKALAAPILFIYVMEYADTDLVKASVAGLIALVLLISCIVEGQGYVLHALFGLVRPSTNNPAGEEPYMLATFGPPAVTGH